MLPCLYLIVLGWGRAWVLKYAFRTMSKLNFGVRSPRRHGRKVSCFLSERLTTHPLILLVSSFLIKTQWANHSFTLGDHVHSRLRDMVSKHRQIVWFFEEAFHHSTNDFPPFLALHSRQAFQLVLDLHL